MAPINAHQVTTPAIIKPPEKQQYIASTLPSLNPKESCARQNDLK
jgi:hypothetical protein